MKKCVKLVITKNSYQISHIIESYNSWIPATTERACLDHILYL